MKHNFKELVIWKRVRAFIVEIYELTKQYPSDEKYDLVSQLRRASVSVSLNIIEGTGRSTNKQLANFLDIAWKYERSSRVFNSLFRLRIYN
jgi:four helix bundle protein